MDNDIINLAFSSPPEQLSVKYNFNQSKNIITKLIIDNQAVFQTIQSVQFKELNIKIYHKTVNNKEMI